MTPKLSVRADQLLHRLYDTAEDPGLSCADCVLGSGPSSASSSSQAAAITNLPLQAALAQAL